MAATGTLADVPSGNITFTVEPGSAVPDTVSVPLGFAVVVAVGAEGAVVSVYVPDVTGERLPAASLSIAVTGPEFCGFADVAE